MQSTSNTPRRTSADNPSADNRLPFVAIVPARLASTRLPNKPLADIGGRPMVIHVADRARQSGAMQVIVATDSQQVFDVVAAHGHVPMLTRADHPSGTDRLAEVATRLGWDDDTLVVNVQGDEPLIDPGLISGVALHLATHADCAMATAAHPITSMQEIFDPNAVKVVIDANGVALYFSRAPIPWFRDQYTSKLDSPVVTDATGTPADADNVRLSITAVASNRRSDAQDAVYRHIGIYAYRAGFLRRFPTLSVSPLERAESLEQLRALWHGNRIAVTITESAPPPGVDTPEDLERARAAFAANRGSTVA